MAQLLQSLYKQLSNTSVTNIVSSAVKCPNSVQYLAICIKVRQLIKTKYYKYQWLNFGIQYALTSIQEVVMKNDIKDCLPLTMYIVIMALVYWS